MTNLLRSYLGLDKEPEKKTEEKLKPDPRLEKTRKFVRPKKRKRYQPEEVEDGGN